MANLTEWMRRMRNRAALATREFLMLAMPPAADVRDYIERATVPRNMMLRRERMLGIGMVDLKAGEQTEVHLASCQPFKPTGLFLTYAASALVTSVVVGDRYQLAGTGEIPCSAFYVATGLAHPVDWDVLQVGEELRITFSNPTTQDSRIAGYVLGEVLR